MEALFVDGPGGRWFRTLQQNYGIKFDVSAQGNLHLPVTAGVSLSEARPVPVPSPSPTKREGIR
jgi:hypothetical protein